MAWRALLVWAWMAVACGARAPSGAMEAAAAAGTGRAEPGGVAPTPAAGSGGVDAVSAGSGGVDAVSAAGAEAMRPAAAGVPASPSAPASDVEDAGASQPEPRAEPAAEPLSGAAGSWTLTEFPDTQCRDGSPAGVFLNLGTSTKLMIYLEGGGRCSNEQTCSTLNPANIAAGDLIRSVASGGVLDRSRADNPVRDWNFVVIPYCTGDRHGGANPNGEVPGVGPQKFLGYANLQMFLKRIVATFRDPPNVVLTGISAGGFGVAYTAPLVQRAFPGVKIVPIIDSGPFVSKAVFTICDQRTTRELYSAERTFLGECGAACPVPDDYWLDYGVFFGKQFGDRPWGLIATTRDLVERAFFGIGAANCTGPLDLLNPGTSEDAYRAELFGLRNVLGSSAGFATFYVESDTHTYLAFDSFYTVSAGGVRLVDWFAKLVNGQHPGHVGP